VEKRQNKTKEQLIAEMEQTKKVNQQRQVVKEKIYPFLLEKSESIEDAKVFMSAIGISIKQAYLNGMKDTPLGDLKMVEMLDIKGANYQRYKDLFEILKDYSITDALKLIEGMPGEIDISIREEMQTRKLDTLKVKLL